MRPFHVAATRFVMIVVGAAAASGCFSSETVIKLHPNGSGTIEQTNLVNTAMIGMVSGMMKSAGESKQAGKMPTADELFSEEQLRKQGEMMGTGVRFVSSEKLSQAGMEGVRAIYAFDKVDAISVGGIGTHDAGSSGPPMLFALAPRGQYQRLTVTLPEPAAATAAADTAPATPPQSTPEIPPEAFAMVKSMFAGARMSVAVEVDGKIVSTNAPASSGPRATLVSIDFGELLSDPSKLQALQGLKPGTDFATVRKTLEGMKGVQIPLEHKVTIDFSH